ncbi:MAG: UTP--glucose-1-phosphate uridylyltransferase [Alphaproteobacteria bacterium]|nr:MAG: UTP--glucose-1-phosphate uridylyltransferase [Alphaproteobacteria bacterium]
MGRNRIITAVIPVAGLGTRMLPATKVVPKELLPVGDRPLIQYVVEECWEAGIERVVLVTAIGKSLIVDHFDRSHLLEQYLERLGKEDALDRLATTLPPETGSIVSVRQPQPLGLGHAVWCARHLIHERPFAVLLPDDFILAQPGCLKQMMAAWEEVGGNLVATITVPKAETHRYGIITPGRRKESLIAVEGLVEKPDPEHAPSRYAVIGRYILEGEVLSALAHAQRGKGGEIQLTDAMATRIGQAPFHALLFDGERFDCGHKAGYLEAQLALGLRDPRVAPQLLARLNRQEEAFVK